MVGVSTPAAVAGDGERIRMINIPVIDFSGKKSQKMQHILKACEDYGFFKVVNHGVPQQVIERMEAEALHFFARPASFKQLAGPANPLGYGCKYIGPNGDQGELEYLLLDTDALSISRWSKSISSDPEKFCGAVNDYVAGVRKLACEILEMVGEGLRVKDEAALAGLIRDADNDSLLRMNHYPCWKVGSKGEKVVDNMSDHRVGFGEHSDPQLLTLLTSNAVGGLQISPHPGVWVSVPPDHTAVFVNVGDALQALTNGRLVSVRHRAMANSCKSRLSIMYFAAPPPHALISPLPEMVSQQNPPLYRPFTWAEYKGATYARRLADRRLDLFKASSVEDQYY